MPVQDEQTTMSHAQPERVIMSLDAPTLPVSQMLGVSYQDSLRSLHI